MKKQRKVSSTSGVIPTRFPRFVFCLVIFGVFLHVLNWKLSSVEEELDNHVFTLMFSHSDGREIIVDEEHGHLDHPLLYDEEDLIEQNEDDNLLDLEKQTNDDEEKIVEKEGEKFDELEDEKMRKEELYKSYPSGNLDYIDLGKYEEEVPISEKAETRMKIGNYFFPEEGYNTLDSVTGVRISYVTVYEGDVQKKDCSCLSPSFCNLVYEQYSNFDSTGDIKRNFLIMVDQRVITKGELIEKFSCLREFSEASQSVSIFYMDDEEEVNDFYRVISRSHYFVRIGFHNELLPLNFEECVIEKNSQMKQDDTLIVSSSKGLILRLYETKGEGGTFSGENRNKNEVGGRGNRYYEEITYALPRIGLTIKNSRYSKKKFHPLFVGHAELVNLVRSSSVSSDIGNTRDGISHSVATPLQKGDEKPFQFDYRSLDLNCDYPFIIIQTPLSCSKQQEQEVDELVNDDNSDFIKLLKGVDQTSGTKLMKERNDFFDCLMKNGKDIGERYYT